MIPARPGMPVVELHGYLPSETSTSDLDGVIDVTEFVASLSWGSGVRQPWESLTVQLLVPRHLLQDLLPGRKVGKSRRPTPGFWVVVRHGSRRGPALAWGRCVRLRATFEPEQQPAGLVSGVRVQIVCESWLSLLGRSRVLLTSANLDLPDEGFMFSLTGWGKAIQTLCSSLDTDLPGMILDRLWTSTVKITVPTSLATGNDGPLEIGRNVPVVYTTVLARRSTPRQAPAMTPVPGKALNAFGNTVPRSTLWDWIGSTFVADPNLVELFPALEVDSAGDLTPLGRALGGSQPALVYRMRPFALVAPTKATIDKALAASEIPRVSGVPASEVLGAWQSPVDAVPATEEHWYTVRADEVVGAVTLEWSDDNRVNAVYAKSALVPRTMLETYGLLGTPVIETGEMTKHGLRLYDADWPFIATVLQDESTVEAGTTSSIDSLIEMAYMLVGQGEVFASGSVSIHYRPWMRAGHWCVLHLDDKGGSAFGDRGRDWLLDLTIYLESVEHAIQVGPDGVVRATTTLSFSRASSGSYSPLPVRGHGFKTRPADPDFDQAGTAGEASQGSDKLTEHVTWEMVDPHGQLAEPTQPEEPDARRRRLEIRDNLRRVANNLEKLLAYLHQTGRSNPALSFLTTATIVATPNGGYHGAWQDGERGPDGHWTGHWVSDNPGLAWYRLHPEDAGKRVPRRLSTSQHRYGRAFDTIVQYVEAGVTKWLPPANVADTLAYLATNGVITQGYIETYPGEPYAHYDIRGILRLVRKNTQPQIDGLLPQTDATKTSSGAESGESLP